MKNKDLAGLQVLLRTFFKKGTLDKAENNNSIILSSGIILFKYFINFIE